MTFLMPHILWMIIPFTLFFIASKESIVIKTHTLILIFLLIAMARPVYKKSIQKADISVQDIIIAVDISYSMHANDTKPTRYLFAKDVLKEFLLLNTTDNIMLFAFTSNPLLLSPPTTDHSLVLVALDSLNPEFILTRGTSLKSLFENLVSISKTHKILILITDGGEESDIDGLVRILKNSNISLVTLALGSQRGTTLPTKEASLLKDKQGNLVITRRNPILQELTEQLNGTFIVAGPSTLSTAKDINAALKKYISKHHIQKERHGYQELYQAPLLVATILFLLLYTHGVKYLIIAFVFLSIPLEASFFDLHYLKSAYNAYKSEAYGNTKKALRSIKNPSLQSRMLLANTYYKESDYKRSIEIYNSIKTSSLAIKQHIYYNTANAYARLHKYTKAKTYYIKTLQLAFDADALHNLKLIATLDDNNKSSVGISNPESQNAQSGKNKKSSKKKNQKPKESQSGASSNSKTEKSSKERSKNRRLLGGRSSKKQPLGSKAYELINKGYIYEKNPW